MKYQYPIVAIHCDGYTELLYSYDAVVEFKKNKVLGEQHVVRYYSFTLHGYENSYYDWILRDDWGRKVDPSEFYGPRYYPYWAYGRSAARRKAAEQGLPIPGCGKRRWHRKSASDKGRNGTYNRDKGLKLYEDPKIKKSEFDDF